jgi:hypothetical protein
LQLFVHQSSSPWVSYGGIASHVTFPGNIVVVTGSIDSDDFEGTEGESDSEFDFFLLGLIILKNQ